MSFIPSKSTPEGLAWHYGFEGNLEAVKELYTLSSGSAKQFILDLALIGANTAKELGQMGLYERSQLYLFVST